MKALFLGFVSAGPTPGALVEVWDGTGTLVGDFGLPLSIGYSDTSATDYWNDISAGIVSGLAGNGVTIATSDIVYIDPILSALSNPLPSSYQTIVTQTSTAAPAVSGSFAPTSTYPSGTTFTWARTGTGVYTLTASTAVFNTAGKTGVFVAPLQNLNASVRAVVTSTTVITVTTAVQSVAVLGLLGLTTTNTDALLSQTMLYIQTYS